MIARGDDGGAIGLAGKVLDHISADAVLGMDAERPTSDGRRECLWAGNE
jgi:hypothetical protein